MTWKRCGICSRACPPDFEEHFQVNRTLARCVGSGPGKYSPNRQRRLCYLMMSFLFQLSTSTRAELVGNVFPCGPRMLLCLLLWDCEVQCSRSSTHSQGMGLLEVSKTFASCSSSGPVWSFLQRRKDPDGCWYDIEHLASLLLVKKTIPKAE